MFEKLFTQLVVLSLAKGVVIVRVHSLNVSLPIIRGIMFCGHYLLRVFVKILLRSRVIGHTHGLVVVVLLWGEVLGWYVLGHGGHGH